MTWKDEIKKKLTLNYEDRGKIADEVVEKLELEKIPDEVLEILLTSSRFLFKEGEFYSENELKNFIKGKIFRLIETAIRKDNEQVLMKNKIFNSVLGEFGKDD